MVAGVALGGLEIGIAGEPGAAAGIAGATGDLIGGLDLKSFTKCPECGRDFRRRLAGQV